MLTLPYNYITVSTRPHLAGDCVYWFVKDGTVQTRILEIHGDSGSFQRLATSARKYTMNGRILNRVTCCEVGL